MTPAAGHDQGEVAGSKTGPDATAPAMPRRLAAEVFGTFALVFAAAGADTMAQLSQGAVTPAARAVAPGLMVAALIYAIANVSGAHFNPAVTLAFTVRGLFPVRMLPGYWAAQVTGAVLGAALLRALFGDAAAAGVSASHVDPLVTLALEIVLTMLLVSVIIGTADRARVIGPEAALAVGATIVMCGLVALPVSGASMNPARSLGPALVMGRWEELAPYLAGPLAGALLACAVMRGLHGGGRDAEGREAALGGGA